MDKGKVKKRLSWWMVPVVVCMFTWLLFRFVLLVGYVPSESMEPSIKKDSCLVAVRVYSGLEVGDAIVFWHDGELLVKRIAAIGGDIVDLRKLYYAHGSMIPKRDEEVVIVPQNCFFVLGDNAENSFDSRYWEDSFVKGEDVIGKVWERKK